MDKFLFMLTLWISLVMTSCLDQDRPMPYYLFEELPPSTLLGNVAVDVKLSEIYSPEVVPTLSYSISKQVDHDGNEINLFSIDSKSSILKTNVQIDRDTLCPLMDSCIVYLEITVSPLEHAELIQATVDILDINDHKPQFPSSVIHRSISESEQPGAMISLPAATDPDGSEYGIKQYELESSSGKFELKVFPRNNGAAASLALLIKEKLDREEANIYQFRLIAYDGGNPSTFGSALINIEIEDTNDNDPKFENATYEVFVMENAPVGTTVGKVNALDLDFGSNAELTYSFTAHTAEAYGHMFGIIPDVGIIYLKESLDFEIGSTYLLTVMATDHGPSSLPAHATVIVRVEDDNDHAPQVTVNTRSPSGKAILAEDVEPGTFVGHISVEDLDGGDNGRVQCQLDNIGSRMFGLQDMYETQYDIVTASDISSESLRDFTVVITCNDLGRNRLTSTAMLHVEIIDANDHAPEFSHRTYTATLQEHNVIGEFVAMIVATDQDQGPNGDVRYAVHPDVESMFTIDPMSGIVTASIEFDRETTHTKDVKVIAYDLGKPNSLSSTATILLTIIDIDDNPPVFTEEKYAFGTYENQPSDTEVGSVLAVDRDGPTYNKFQYSFQEKYTDASRTFSIDPISGFIHTKKRLDREKRSVYYLTVVARGQTSSHLSGTTSVTIYVADKNDNAPYVSWPSAMNNTVYASSEVPHGYEVARVMATDQDLGNNGKLTYQIMTGNENAALNMDSDSGLVTVEHPSLFVEKQIYRLNILVRDHGDPVLMTPTELSIIVNTTLVYHKPELEEVPSSFNNTTIVISLTCAGLFLVFLLIIAIVLIKRQAYENKAQTYQSTVPEPINPGKRTEAQTMLAYREDCPDGRETIAEWTSAPGTLPRTSTQNNQSEPAVYHQQREVALNMPLEENEVNLKKESKKLNIDRKTFKRPTLSIQDFLKPCNQAPSYSSADSGRDAGAGTFSEMLTSPRCLTMCDSPSPLDDPVLKEVKIQDGDRTNPADCDKSTESEAPCKLENSNNNVKQMMNDDNNTSDA